MIIAGTMVIADAARMATFLALLMTGLYNGLYGDYTYY
jgi:hypothetical protein